MNPVSTRRLPVLCAAYFLTGWLAPALHAAGPVLYLGTSSAIQSSNTIQSVGTNGTGDSLLFTASGKVDRCTAVAVDSLNSNIFLADADASQIWSLNLAGGNLTPLNATLAYATGLALDPVNKQIYYATSSTVQGSNTVQVVDYIGLGNSLIFTAGNGNPVRRCTSIAYDPVNALIFVGDAGGNAIWSMNTRGANLTQVAGGLPGAPLDLAVDADNQLIYYVTSSATQTGNTVQRVGYNGADAALLFTATGSTSNGVQRCTSLDLDLANAKIYFSDAGSNALWVLPMAGGSATLINGNLSPATIKKVRLLAPSSLGPNAHLGYGYLVENTPNLLAYWPFSPSTQANSFDNGYIGTFQGSAAIGPSGSGPPLLNDPGNTAVLLNGVNSFVNTSLVGGFDTNGPTADQGAIVAWFNLSALPSTAGRFFSIAGESDFGNDFDLQIETDNEIKFYTDSGSATVDSTPLTAANLNTWMFVAATFNSNLTRNIYLNGALVASSTPGGAHNPASAGIFAMGASDVFSGRYFDGALDEIAVFNRALSSTEISTLYSAGLGIAFIPLTIHGTGADVTVTWTDPTALFQLQFASNAGGVFSNLPGAASPYVAPAAGAAGFFRLKSQ